MNDNFGEINVEEALADKDSVFYYYQKLIQLRHELPIITTGHYQLLDPEDEEVYTYKRIGDDEELLVINNFTESEQSRDYGVPANAEILISNYPDDQGTTLRPFEAKVYRYKN